MYVLVMIQLDIKSWSRSIHFTLFQMTGAPSEISRNIDLVSLKVFKKEEKSANCSYKFL